MNVAMMEGKAMYDDGGRNLDNKLVHHCNVVEGH